jgi:uncharacterized Ntn-hydrolase superfamily protein
MDAGLTPQEIIDSMLVSDSGLNPSIRQYGVVMLVNGQPQVKAYTGANCMDYKNHIEGVNYSIQGNILLGQQVLDSMEAHFLNTEGDLACKLMAAMQGAKMVGADTRCMSSGNSSLSSFLKVARPTDSLSNLYINLNVNQGSAGFEPIDSLQTLFDQTHNCITTSSKNYKHEIDVEIFPNPGRNYTLVRINGTMQSQTKNIQLTDISGSVVFETTTNGNEITIAHQHLAQGSYMLKIFSNNALLHTGRVVLY